MGAFDLGADLARVSRETNEAVAQLGKAASPFAKVNADGSVILDENQVRAQYSRTLPQPWGEGLAPAVIEYSRAGMLLVQPSVRLTQGAAVPLMALEDIVCRRRGVPNSIREELGLTVAVDGEEAARLLHRKFPSLPPDVFPPETAALPRLEPISWLAEPFVRDVRAQPPPRPRPNIPPPYVPTSAAPSPEFGEEYVAAALCIVNATWGGWWDGWFGWVPGFRFCLAQDCGNTLAYALLDASSPLPGPIGVAQALYTLVTQGGLEAALATLVTAAGIVLSLIGYALAFNILAVNGSSGVCIYCSWPYTGGIVFWAAPQ